MTMITANLQQIQSRVAAACASAGRLEESVRLLAVSKTFGADAVREAFEAGQRAFGENYVQEGVDKIATLQDLRADGDGIEWHMIGPLQSNKTRVVAEHFDWVHSVDRLKIAQRLSEQRPAHLPPLQLCLQVNISGEATKSGLLPADVADIARTVSKLPRVVLRGLMAIPEPADTLEAQRAPHRALHALMQSLQEAGLQLDTLSIGMSADLEAAVMEGATMVRIGSAIFGSRPSAR
ncbi:YggS family pyridoxal phosphate-dependent enzyme [Variovorax sp. RHLX14]|uniref:YggS family pyridoxal phosphate-dependent enzyme n=1 Tax=Variovorax sp. RHLX14 TaxID=1259731 RepID=UPI003F46D21F